MRFFGSAPPEQRFWRWFGDHEDELFEFERDQTRVFDALTRALREVHEDLTFEFGPVQQGRRDFVISAGGIRDAFPAVHALADAAPELPRWRLIRFRPPRNADVELALGGVRVRARAVVVAAEPDGERLGLTLFIPGYRPTPEHVYEQIGYLLLDNALGEYVVETRIGYIAFADAADTPPAGAMPLPELPSLVPHDVAD